MNLFERKAPGAKEAEVQYLDGDFRIVRPGSFVLCAATGQQIPIEEMRYWDVDRQEAYVSTDAIMDRLNGKARKVGRV